LPRAIVVNPSPADRFAEVRFVEHPPYSRELVQGGEQLATACLLILGVAKVVGRRLQSKKAASHFSNCEDADST
jgi:hypothetical protein